MIKPIQICSKIVNRFTLSPFVLLLCNIGFLLCCFFFFAFSSDLPQLPKKKKEFIKVFLCIKKILFSCNNTLVFKVTFFFEYCTIIQVTFFLRFFCSFLYLNFTVSTIEGLFQQLNNRFYCLLFAENTTLLNLLHLPLLRNVS